MFSVFDSKVGVYAQPFFVPSRGAAVRSFSDACVDDSLPFKKHPADYRLFYLGVYDDVAGSFEGVIPEPVIGGDEI
ncbi:MAG: nonstructural protein [Microvirus sp.]|nr:MAG: nonstructural protein [Microvirus sp.]